MGLGGRSRDELDQGGRRCGGQAIARQDELGAQLRQVLEHHPQLHLHREVVRQDRTPDVQVDRRPGPNTLLDRRDDRSLHHQGQPVGHRRGQRPAESRDGVQDREDRIQVTRQ